MSCFCFKPSVVEAPEGPPEKWTKTDVKQWLKSENLKYSNSLKDVDGKKLLETSRVEWETVLGAGPSQVLCKAINELQQQAPRAAVLPMEEAKQEPLPNNANDELKPNEQLEFTDRVTAGSEMMFAPGLLQEAGFHPAEAKESLLGHSEDTAADSGAPPLLGDVRRVFEAFASFGFPETQTEMDSTKLMKTMRECGLIDAKLTSVDVDLFFIKAKPVKRRITFEQFLDVISLCADKKGVVPAVLLQTIVNKGGPDSTGTKAQAVRLADDKSTFTGVAKRGGPSTVDEAHDLATILDRTDRTSRRSTGGKHPAGKPPTGAGNTLSSASPFSKSCVMSVRRSTMSSGGTVASMQGDGHDLQSMFEAFASFGSRTSSGGRQAAIVEMDRSRFAKLCRECDLVDSTAADIVFSQHLKKGSNKVTFESFKACLEQIARDKAVELSSLEHTVVTSGGPMINTACV